MAISPVSTRIAREVFHTSLAGVATKGVGSTFRVWDDRHAPRRVKTNTLKREAATLGMVSVFTAGIDLAGQKIAQKAAQNPALKALIAKGAKNHILYKAVPVTLGIAMAEILSRKWAPRDIWDEDGHLDDSVSKLDDDDDDHEDWDDDDRLKFSQNNQDRMNSAEKKTALREAKRLPLTFAQAAPSQPGKSLSPGPFPVPSATPFTASPLVNPFNQVVFPQLPQAHGPAAMFQV